MSKKFSLETVKKFLEENKRLLKDKFGVREIGIFGSLARGEEKRTSDVDILVEFEKGQETFKNYMGLKYFLEDSLGKKVDLVTAGSIKPLIKEEILQETVYA